MSFHHFSIINDKKNGHKNALKQRGSAKRKLCVAHSRIPCSQREKQQGRNRMAVIMTWEFAVRILNEHEKHVLNI